MITLSICWKAILSIVAIITLIILFAKWIIDLSEERRYAIIVAVVLMVLVGIILLSLLYVAFASCLC